MDARWPITTALGAGLGAGVTGAAASVAAELIL